MLHTIADTFPILGGFLHYLSEDWTDMHKFAGTGWANTEYRSYNFSGQEAEKAHFIETQASCARREEKPLDKEERCNLTRTGQKGTDDSNSSHAQASQVQAKV